MIFLCWILTGLAQVSGFKFGNLLKKVVCESKLLRVTKRHSLRCELPRKPRQSIHSKMRLSTSHGTSLKTIDFGTV
jgi:hypothetical protein